MKRILLLAGALLLTTLLTGCEEETQSREQYYVLWITARVIDEQGNPIQGIYAYPEGYAFPGREGYSDHTGALGGSCHIKPTTSINIIFEDVDGEYNNGEYAQTVVDITPLLTPPTEPDKWGYSGQSFIELDDIVMSLKQ